MRRACLCTRCHRIAFSEDGAQTSDRWLQMRTLVKAVMGRQGEAGTRSLSGMKARLYIGAVGGVHEDGASNQ
jgi:hypothetical protein